MAKQSLTLIDSRLTQPANATLAAITDDLAPRRAEELEAPRTIDVDVSGAASFRLVIDDPLNLIATGQCGVRLDSEISEDGGKNWRSHGIDPWHPGQQRSPKSGEHFVEERAMAQEKFQDAGGHDCVRMVPTNWPPGWIFRYHWRQSAPAKIGLKVEVNR